MYYCGGFRGCSLTPTHTVTKKNKKHHTSALIFLPFDHMIQHFSFLFFLSHFLPLCILPSLLKHSPLPSYAFSLTPYTFSLPLTHYLLHGIPPRSYNTPGIPMAVTKQSTSRAFQLLSGLSRDKFITFCPSLFALVYLYNQGSHLKVIRENDIQTRYTG